MTMDSSPSVRTSGSPHGLADLPFGSEPEAFGCTINRIGVEDLFARYEACGFLYAAKRERLAPHLPRIVENWRRSLSSAHANPTHEVMVYDHSASGAWAAVGYWATTNGSVHSQHLVSMGRPEGSRAVLLAAQCRSWQRSNTASQNWFRAENRYPARVFGSCVLALGADHAAVQTHGLLTVPRDRLPAHASGIDIHRASEVDAMAIDRLARRLCGPVQAAADEWQHGDVELKRLDERYQAVGLRRFRHVYVATASGMIEPIGLAVAYRGPLGLNFSFLENRCEVWVDPNLDNERHADTTLALVRAASATYADFELPSMLVTTDQDTASVLTTHGGSRVQDYTRSTWLRNGFAAWYGHVNGFYARVIAAANRRGTSGNNSSATGAQP